MSGWVKPDGTWSVDLPPPEPENPPDKYGKHVNVAVNLMLANRNLSRRSACLQAIEILGKPNDWPAPAPNLGFPRRFYDEVQTELDKHRK